MTLNTRVEQRALAPLDTSTIAAVAIVAYLAASVIHEGIGHGMTALLLGAHVKTIASTFCDFDAEGLPHAAKRAIDAGGTLANLAFGLLFWGLLRTLRGGTAAARLFLWLSMVLNLLQAAGYLAVPTLIGFGDWIEFLHGLAPEWAWRGPLVAVGAVLYGLFAFVGVRELEPLIGREITERRRRLRAFTLVPYFAGGLAVCVSGAFNPISPKLIVISAAAATFGGTSGLVWLPSWSIGRGPGARTPEVAPPLSRNRLWISFGALALVVLVAILGRGIPFGD